VNQPRQAGRISPALTYTQAITDATHCTPTLALDLGIKVAARRLPLATAIAAARLGTPYPAGNVHQAFPIGQPTQTNDVV
jgi:hypothetical protein